MNHLAKVSVFYTALFLALGAFWFWMALAQTSLITLPPQTKLQCLSYAPFGKDESPFDLDTGLTLSDERMDKDLELLARYTGCIRTYSSLGLENIPALARKHGLTMWLGVWVSSDPLSTQKEIDKAIALAKANADVVETVVVGNEVLLRREMSASQLITRIKEVKKALPNTPVTYADVWEFWNQHPSVIPAVDRVTIHILPYWEDEPIAVDKALLHVKDVYEEMARNIPDKQIVIGETGWPSQGRMREGASPSPTAQAAFVRGFVHMAEEEGWKYNIIEAFDQPWKRANEGTVGGYWGLFDADRLDKHTLHGQVSNFPNALWLFLGSVGFALAGSVLLFDKKACPAQHWPYLFAVLFGGALTLAWQTYAYTLTCRSPVEYGWALLSLGVAFVLWVKLMRFMVTGATGKRGSLGDALGVLMRQTPWNADTKEDMVHLFAASIVFMSAIGLAFDGRYRNFELGALGVIAFVYLAFFVSKKQENENSLLEKASALMLFFLGVNVLFTETLSNTNALLWVAFVLLFGLTLWRSKEPLEGLIKPATILLVSGFAFWLLKENIYVKESLVETCALAPQTLVCVIRLWLGKIVHFNIAGWLGLFLALCALALNSFVLAMIAMALALFCLLLFNGTFGALIFVLGWWVVGYRISKRQNMHEEKR